MILSYKEHTPIDFVITWVDGNDPKWNEEKKSYQPEKNTDDSVVRYRDWDNLQYWFRAVEKYAPWVNKIHFVTSGHLPKWLNVNHPKLNIVKHTDYIPTEYLPTFSSHPIELNLHRIEGLAEQFVYFNDDTFLNAPVKPEDFFKNGKPVDRLILSAITPSEEVTSRVIFNCVRVINKYFSKKELVKKNLLTLTNPFYGKDLMKTFLTMPFNMFTGFQNDHLPIAYTKALFEEVWKAEYELLHQTSMRKFRNENDVSQWLFRYWNMAQGNISPCSSRHGKFFNITSNNDKLYKAILNTKYKMLCCNDSDIDDDFEIQKQALIDIFEKKFPQKSGFEK